MALQTRYYLTKVLHKTIKLIHKRDWWAFFKSKTWIERVWIAMNLKMLCWV